jgi:hypothetical protein
MLTHIVQPRKNLGSEGMANLASEQALLIHARLIDETGGEQGVRDLGL